MSSPRHNVDLSRRYWIDLGSPAVERWAVVTSLKTAGQIAEEGTTIHLEVDGKPVSMPAYVVRRSKRGGNYVKKVSRW